MQKNPEVGPKKFATYWKACTAEQKAVRCTSILILILSDSLQPATIRCMRPAQNSLYVIVTLVTNYIIYLTLCLYRLDQRRIEGIVGGRWADGQTTKRTEVVWDVWKA